jgi:hypothetical protein
MEDNYNMKFNFINRMKDKEKFPRMLIIIGFLLLNLILLFLYIVGVVDILNENKELEKIRFKKIIISCEDGKGDLMEETCYRNIEEEIKRNNNTVILYSFVEIPLLIISFVFFISFFFKEVINNDKKINIK